LVVLLPGRRAGGYFVAALMGEDLPVYDLQVREGVVYRAVLQVGVGVLLVDLLYDVVRAYLVLLVFSLILPLLLTILGLKDGHL
jgi:hypothetical protein